LKTNSLILKRNFASIALIYAHDLRFAKLLISGAMEHRIFSSVEPRTLLKIFFRELLHPCSPTGIVTDTGLAEALGGVESAD
jgi:hypothetical protein